MIAAVALALSLGARQQSVGHKHEPAAVGRLPIEPGQFAYRDDRILVGRMGVHGWRGGGELTAIANPRPPVGRSPEPSQKPSVGVYRAGLPETRHSMAQRPNRRPK